MASAIHVAVNHKHTHEEAFGNALVIIKHWGKLGQDVCELSYDEAIRTLAGKEEWVEDLKAERAEVDMIVRHVELNVNIGKSLLDVAEAALRVLYEYHLWDEGESDD